MLVNTDVYGEESSWVNLFSGTAYADTSIPKTTASNMYNGYLTGKFTINQKIDDSIAVLGVDNGCCLLNQCIVKNPSKDADIDEGSGNVSYKQLDIICEMTKNSVNPLCYMNPRTSTITLNTPSSTHLKSYHGYQQELAQTTAFTSLYPVTKMPVKDVSYVIMVTAGDVMTEDPHNIIGGSGKTFDLYTYCYGKMESDLLPEAYTNVYKMYPYIMNVSLMPVYRNKTQYSPDNPATTIYRLTNSDFLRPMMPVIMNGFNQTTDPFTDDDKPFQVLNYLQPLYNNTRSGDIFYYDFHTLPAPIVNIKKSSPLYNPVVMQGFNTYSPSTFTPDCLMQIVGYDRMNIKFFKRTSGSYTNIYLNGWSEVGLNFANIDIFYKYWLKQTAYLGGLFSDSYDVAIHSGKWDEEHTFIGTIDSNGVTHGDYTEGIDNVKQKQYDWTDFESNNYNPSGNNPSGDDNEVPSDPYNFNRHYFGLQSGNYYVMTSQQLDALNKWIDTATNPSGNFVVDNAGSGDYTYEELSQEMRKLFNGQYPEDMLLSLTYYPFDILNNLNGVNYTANSNIKLGSVQTSSRDWFDSTLPNAYGVKLNSGNQYAEFTTQPYTINEHYGDFRDYPPYTSMQISIPYHSTIPLDVGILYGHSVYVHVFCDITTGASTAFVLRDNGIPIATVDGQMGVPQMLISRNVGQYITGLVTNAQNINQLKYQTVTNATNAIGAGIGVIGDIATGNVGGALQKTATASTAIPMGMLISNQKTNTQIELKHSSAGSTVISQNAPSVSLVADTNVRLIIHRPKTLPSYDPQTYADTVGFACFDSGNIGSFKGFSVFSGANLDGLQAPENVKNMIYSLLQSGVYL